MIKLPIGGQWSQPNNSDKFGSLWYTKNVNLDEEGYIKLSPRAVILTDEAANGDFGVPLAIGRFSPGELLVATSSNANFNIHYSGTALEAEENDGSNEPALTAASHAIFWQNLWFASTATAILSRAISSVENAAWTSRITGLTSGVRHYMRVFESRLQLCVTNGNVIKQYNTSYSGTIDLTIPADFEVMGLAYNNERMGIITRLGGASEGQAREAYFFVWDGATTAANAGVGVGAPSAIAVCAYKSSFAVLSQAGQLLYWNGGGFDVLASFPFYFTDKVWGDILNQIGLGDLMVAEGDVLYINVGFRLEAFGRKEERSLQNLPSGIWCFDPKIGLYHKASPSISKLYLLTASSVDTTTNIITVSGTIPATGNPIRYAAASTPIGGLTENHDYYIIKLSSSTLKLARSKEEALSGAALDLTSAGSSSFFWAFDLVDYGNSFHETAGAIAPLGSSTHLYRDFIFGGDYGDTALSSNDALCISVPYLENRGYIVTPKVYSSAVEDKTKHLIVRYRPLAVGDAIIVKKKTSDVLGLPVSTTGTTGAEWVGARELYVAADLSEAKAHLDAGGVLEMEIVSGAGGGTLVQVESMAADAGTYSIVLSEDVLGAALGRKCHFILDNWEAVHTITDGSYAQLPIESTSKWVDFKVELRGYLTTIEELLIVNEPFVLTK